MKLSFSLPSKSSSKPKISHPTNPTNTVPDANAKEYVTEFDPSKTLTNSRPIHVIPPIENEWKPYKRMKNLELPLPSGRSDSGLHFEVESIPSDPQPGADKIAYGLNLRQNGKDDTFPNAESEDMRSKPVEQVLLQSLRDDLERLPDDRGFEEFKDVSVEDFAVSLLAGYGWKEGKGVGKNHKEDVKVKEYKKWTNREGLGFDVDTMKVPESKNIKKDRANSDLLMDEKGKSGRSIETVDEDGFGFRVGEDMRIIEGRYMGLKGTIVKKLKADFVILKLLKREEEVKVHADAIAELGSREEEKCLKKLKEMKTREETLSNRKEKQKEVGERNRATDSNVNFYEENVDQIIPSREKVSWLRSHIRVRIISKDLRGGRLYLKKGEVVDVVGPTICDIAMDEKREIVQGVDQDLLETALPRRGGPVVILYGRHKGVYGNLVEKDLDKEKGVVRDANNHELLNVKLEQIAEYVGDPSALGY